MDGPSLTISFLIISLLLTPIVLRKNLISEGCTLLISLLPKVPESRSPFVAQTYFSPTYLMPLRTKIIKKSQPLVCWYFAGHAEDFPQPKRRRPFDSKGVPCTGTGRSRPRRKVWSLLRVGTDQCTFADTDGVQNANTLLAEDIYFVSNLVIISSNLY